MKLLCDQLLSEYGLFENKEKITRFVKIYTRERMDIALKEDGSYYYSNTGFDYPLKDLARLRKLYKELRRIKTFIIKTVNYENYII